MSSQQCVTVTIREKPKPNIVVESITVSKTEAYIGETVTVKAVVKNIGNASGSANVALLIDGVRKAGEYLTLDAGEEDTVTWNITFSATGSFKVCAEVE